MEPRIQYAKTKDGVSIAYASRGQGPVLVLAPAAFGQFTLLRESPAQRDFLDQLGQGRRLVHYDRRGFGLSQREVTEFSLESEVADLDAVYAEHPMKDLQFLKELIEAGRVTPVIDRTYPLSEVPQAILYFEEGHARGKVVITV